GIQASSPQRFERRRAPLNAAALRFDPHFETSRSDANTPVPIFRFRDRRDRYDRGASRARAQPPTTADRATRGSDARIHGARDVMGTFGAGSSIEVGSRAYGTRDLR